MHCPRSTFPDNQNKSPSSQLPRASKQCPGEPVGARPPPGTEPRPEARPPPASPAPGPTAAGGGGSPPQGAPRAPGRGRARPPGSGSAPAPAARRRLRRRRQEKSRPVPTQPPRGADPRAVLAHGHGSPGLKRLPGGGSAAGGSGTAVGAPRGPQRSSLRSPAARPAAPRPGRAAAGPAELPRPRRDAAARLASPRGVAGALRSPAQHKPGLSPSLREVSCHHSGRGKQKLQSREREEKEEGQRKQRSEGHCSPAAPLPSAADSRGWQPAQCRFPICFGGGSAARAAPRNRRTEEQAGEPAPPPLPPVRPCPPAGCTPRPARRRRRRAAEPRPRRGSASRGRAHAPAERLPPPPVAVGASRRSGRAAPVPSCPGRHRLGSVDLQPPPPPPVPFLIAQRRAGCSCKVEGVSLKIQVKDAEEHD
ncbi:unnamed protein product [Coccothraustes coccothraustes]